MTQSNNVQVIECGRDGLQSLKFHLKNSINGDEYFLENCHLCDSPSAKFQKVYHGNIEIDNHSHTATLCLYDQNDGVLNIKLE
jgi:hypothetical protein